MNVAARALLLAFLSLSLGGCVLTKLATTPMRIVGATGSVLGAGLSIVPVAGNTVDASLEKVDHAIDETADKIDQIPL